MGFDFDLGFCFDYFLDPEADHTAVVAVSFVFALDFEDIVVVSFDLVAEDTAAEDAYFAYWDSYLAVLAFAGFVLAEVGH